MCGFVCLYFLTLLLILNLYYHYSIALILCREMVINKFSWIFYQITVYSNNYQ